MQYMTHPKHGAMHAYDQGEIERLEKAGWKKDEMPSADEIRAKKAAGRKAELKAELEALEEVVEAPKKRGRKPKAE